jgi:hypothetical protein
MMAEVFTVFIVASHPVNHTNVPQKLQTCRVFERIHRVTCPPGKNPTPRSLKVNGGVRRV